MRTAATLATLVATLLLNGCATVKGTVMGSYQGPETFYQDYKKEHPKHPDALAKAATGITAPFSIVRGAAAGALTGLSADVYFLFYQKYPEDRNPFEGNYEPYKR